MSEILSPPNFDKVPLPHGPLPPGVHAGDAATSIIPEIRACAPGVSHEPFMEAALENLFKISTQCYYAPMRNYYGFIGTFIAKPGKRDELLAILLKAADVLQTNNECLLYVMGTSDTEPDALWSNEIWTSKAAHDASLEPEDVKAVISQAMPLIASMGSKTELTIVGGKGL